MDKNALDSILLDFDTLKDFDAEAEKAKVLANPKIKELIEKLNLNKMQINDGMHLLQRYYDYWQANQQEPEWSLFVNVYNHLDIDFTNSQFVKKQKEYERFWLTQITPLEPFLQSYYDVAEAPLPVNKLREINKKLLANWKPLRREMLNIIKSKRHQGLLIIDPSFINAKNIFSFLALKLVQLFEDKTAAIIDTNSLYSFYYNNFRNPVVLTRLIDHLSNVDYLFIDKFAVGTKSEGFISDLINVFIARESSNKMTFIASPIDFSSKDISLINGNFKNSNNLGLQKVEDVLKTIIKRTTQKFVLN
ncbi:hypothetical protein FJO69_02715 [[Mycoplasma] falconis]|uniref:Uncharacterized protein n=1 Tax=[Mycoplasma] falconis TaxID=92403 RepID=A0A501X869_9BACT|nr:hypothetical protein [[Mycoplasma] falconis]TPE56758.1 hypothetical protein FJO69_02715 [[Mycoplasma] falconis]